MHNIQIKFRKVADASAASVTSLCFVFYKTDCFGKVLKLQTLRIALWDRICVWEQPSHYSWVVLCSVTILGARKKTVVPVRIDRDKREKGGVLNCNLLYGSKF